MTYKTRQKLLGFLFPLTLCLAAASCGSDPALGVWTNSTLPTPGTGSSQQYSSYTTSLTFAEVLSVSADVETTRTMGALTFAGCTESLKGTGTYAEVGTTLTSTFTTGTHSRTGCVYMADNLAEMPLDAANKATLASLSSGTFTVLVDTLTLTMGGTTYKYTKQLQ